MDHFLKSEEPEFGTSNWRSESLGKAPSRRLSPAEEESLDYVSPRCKKAVVGLQEAIPPRPTDAKWVRSMKSRTADDRKANSESYPTGPDYFDLRDESAVAKEHEVPWDLRSPAGPSAGGPVTRWRGQAYRESSARLANRGGSKKEQYALYYRKKAEALSGSALFWYHPSNKDGHFARGGGGGGGGGEAASSAASGSDARK